MRHVSLLSAVVLAVSGCKSSSDVVIGVSVVTFLPGQAPANYQSVTAVVGDKSKGEYISDARVTVNGEVLRWESGGSQYLGNVEVSPGAQITVTVSARGKDYSVSATQFTTFPTITAPDAGSRWPARCTNDVAWSPGSPESGASYLVDVFGGLQTDPFSMWESSPIPAGSPDGRHAQVPQLGVGSETPALVAVSIVRQVAISDAAPESTLIVGGATTLPVTVDPQLRNVTSVAVVPADLIFPGGAVVPYVASGTFCDGTVDAVADGVIWSSTDAAVARVETDGGMALTVGPGRTTISAQVGALIGSTSLTIQGAAQDSGIRSDNLTAVGWSGSGYVAVGSLGTLLSSPDGVQWVNRGTGLNLYGASLSGVASSGSQFVVVGCPLPGLSPGTAVLTSPDGIAWTIQDAGLLYECLNGVTWTGAEFVAVGTTSTVITSADGVVWTAQDAGLPEPERVNLFSVASSGTRLVAVGSDNSQAPLLVSSDDGRAWTVEDLGLDAGLVTVNGVTWSGTRFVAVGSVTPFVSDGHEEGGLIATSPDGVTWSRQASGTGHGAGLYRVARAGSRVLAMGSNTGVLTSPDGVSWAPWLSAFEYPPVWQLNGAAGSDAQFVLVGNFGTVVTGP
jgi:hypothetical protein